MNIERIYKAVEADEMNSPLPTIINELEDQRYKFKLKSFEVTTQDIQGEIFSDIDNEINKFEVELTKGDQKEQSFNLSLTVYHKFNFQDCSH